MYGKIETNDEGEITMKKVMEHIKGKVNISSTVKSVAWRFIQIGRQV